MFLQWLYAPLASNVLARARASGSVPFTKAKCDCDETAVSFHFDARADQDLSPAKRASFAAQFQREIALVTAWCGHEGWTLPRLPKLQVFVAADYEISRALVPAWHGRRGRLEFPLGRVVARKAAIAHELIHVYFPNGNRFLAEGLAIYLQSILGENPAFPNFGRPLHDVARERLREMAPGLLAEDVSALAAVNLAELDAIPTPNPLALTAAQRFYQTERRVQAGIYAVVGSFFQFLTEAHGLARFRRLYERTPLRVSRLNAGSPERWLNAYGHSFADLEAQWKSLIAGARLHPPTHG